MEHKNLIDILNEVRNFMIEDIDKALNLVTEDRGAPNMMLALSLCCYTEVWGKLLNPEKKAKDRFDLFLETFGNCYKELIHHSNASIYGHIRSEFVHGFVLKQNWTLNVVIEGNGECDKCGILFDAKNKIYTFCVRRYFEDFKTAVDRSIPKLTSSGEVILRTRKALNIK